MVELPEGSGVEGTGLHAFHPDVSVPKLAQAAAQLTGGAAGERDRKHMPRVDHASPYRVGDAVSNGPCLARAGARQHAYRSPRRPGDLALLGIECGQHGFGIVRSGLSVHRSPPARAIIPHRTDSRAKPAPRCSQHHREVVGRSGC